jgi:hypothetical protein
MDIIKSQNKFNTEFKNILIDINTLMNIDESNFNEFYKNRGFSNFGYLESFVDELNESFLKNVNKNDTLKYYLFELNFLNREFVINNNELIFKKRFDGTDLSFQEKSTLEAYDLFDIVLTEITLCCSKFNLNFYKICDEINFDYSFTDTGLIDVFDKEKTENKEFDSEINEKKLPANSVSTKLFANQYERIFNSDFAFTLFEIMHELYKDENTPLANYSFLYFAMCKNEYVICGATDFKKFLANYDISIDKIDTRQCKNPKKLKLYLSKKDSLIHSTS